MSGVGDRRPILKHRSNSNYRSPKVFTKRYRDRNSKAGFNISRKGIENIIIIIFLFLGIYWLFFSNYFKVRDVIVENNKTITNEEIANFVPKGKNIFFYKTADLRDQLANKYPQIKEVAFFKGLPNAIKVQLLEREGQVIWQSNNVKYLIDNQGVVSRIIFSDEQMPDLPVVVDQKNRPVSPKDQLLSIEFIDFVIQTKSNFTTATNMNITDISINETTYDLLVSTNRGIKIFFDTTKSSESQLKNLTQILTNYNDQIKEYVDLRVEGWGYFK
jgi:cell division septal protein FtsQ